MRTQRTQVTATYADSGYDCNGVCLNDEDQDGICDEFEVGGCTDNTACNFSNDATDDDNSCSYADVGYDCAGNCLVDSDGDGTCDQDEVTGCQDDMACNYDAQQRTQATATMLTPVTIAMAFA